MPAKDFGKYSLARNAILANLMQRAGFRWFPVGFVRSESFVWKY
jgi:hypothetical protein